MQVDLHYVEYVFLDVLDWPDGALERGMVWYLLPEKVSRFLAAGHTAGVLEWESFPSDEALVQHLREIKAGLPPAERAFDMAILLDPVTEDYQLGLVTCYARQRKYEDAIALSQHLIERHPEDPKFWMLQGNAYIGLQQPGKAAEKFENDKDKYLEISQAFNCLNDPKMKYDYDYKKRNQPNK